MHARVACSGRKQGRSACMDAAIDRGWAGRHGGMGLERGGEDDMHACGRAIDRREKCPRPAPSGAAARTATMIHMAPLQLASALCMEAGIAAFGACGMGRRRGISIS